VSKLVVVRDAVVSVAVYEKSRRRPEATGIYLTVATEIAESCFVKCVDPFRNKVNGRHTENEVQFRLQ